MIYLLLADGFEEVEALTPVDVLRRCGANVTTVGVDGISVTGARKIEVKADIELSGLNKSDMELLILPGGPGHRRLAEDDVRNIITYAAENGITIAAICAAPSVIGEMGLLEGKRATCFPGYENSLKGAVVSAAKVETDGNFITAKGAGAASEFAFAIAERVCGREKAESVKSAMQY